MLAVAVRLILDGPGCTGPFFALSMLPPLPLGWRAVAPISSESTEVTGRFGTAAVAQMLRPIRDCSLMHAEQVGEIGNAVGAIGNRGRRGIQNRGGTLHL